MSKKILSATQLTALATELKSHSRRGGDACLYKRLQVVHSVATGAGYSEVINNFKVSTRAASGWYQKYFTQGLTGLQNKPVSGRPFILTPSQEQEVIGIALNQTPEAYDFNTGTWTAPLLRKVIFDRWQVEIKSNTTIYNLFKKNGISYRKVQLVNKESTNDQDFDFSNRVSNAFYSTWSPGEKVALLSCDEMSLSNNVSCGYAWGCGQRKISVSGRQTSERCTIFGVVEMGTGRVLTYADPIPNAVSFLYFLDYVVSFYKKEGYDRIVLVLDNAKIHHAKLLKPFLEEHKDFLQLVYLPPYAPHLNPIERVWWLVRKSISHNRYMNSLEERLKKFFELVINWEVENTTIQKLCA